jgi:4-hydroxymandelate oxidase
MTTTRRELLFSTGALAGASMLPVGSSFPALTLQQSQDVSREVDNALNVWDFKAIAEKRLPGPTWSYLTGGAADEITLRWNRESFDKIRLRPNVLVDATPLDTRISLFGQEMPFPILLCPTGSHRAIHPEGELATARGAGMAGATMVVSTPATTAVEEIAKATTHPLWFQLYVQRDHSFTRDLVLRAQDAGCQAICVTLDSVIQGPRNRQTRSRFRLAEGTPQPHKQKSQTPEKKIFSTTKDPSFSWKDIDWLRSFTRVPLLLKGILDAADAERALQEGADGIIVSNHGGRNLDTVPATIDALPEIVDQVAGRIPILMDSGVRRGTDVLKALGVGASAVMVGRPYLYGLASAGAEGVQRVMDILRTELEMAMILTGRTTIAQIDRSVLW